MFVFGNDTNTRGCFVALRMDTGEARGAQLELPDGNFLPEEDYSFPLTVMGFSFQQAENVSYVKCFGDYTYTYAFGHNPEASNLTVQFAGMLRKGTENVLGQDSEGGGGGGGLSEISDTMVRAYNDNRVFNSLNYAKFSVGSNDVLSGFIVGMSSSTLDPQVSLQQFNMTIQLVEAQGK